MPITRAQCEAKGFIWNEETQTCTMPRIKLITMTLSRGSSCDGGAKPFTISKTLPLSVQKTLIKAAKPRRRSSRPR